MSQCWTVVLEGKVIAGGTDLPDPIVVPPLGWIDSPPEGLGVPPLRVEDQTYPQRDGVTHYLDWYEPRIVTLPGAWIRQDGCAGLDAREKAAELLLAWARHCDDTELVIWPEVDDTVGSAEIVGPFGLRGKPRVAEIRWLGQGSKSAACVFRFDATDHRLYLLDADGTPGSGTVCEDLDLQTISTSRLLIPDLRYGLNTPSGSTTETDNPDGLESVDWSLNPNILSGMAPVAAHLGTSTYFNTPHLHHIITADVEYLHSYDWNDYDTFTFWWKTLESGATDILTWEEAEATNETTLSTSGIDVDGITLETFSVGTKAILEDEAGHYLAFVVSGANTLFYIDGILAETITGHFLQMVPFGVFPNFGFFSELSLYSDALTAAQLLALQQAGAGLTTETFSVAGNVCVPVVITFTGPLVKPIVQLADGSFVGLNLTLPAGATATIDTETGMATFDFGTSKSDVTPQITGDPFLTIGPGSVDLAGASESDADTGTIEICWRPAVVSA